MARALVQYNYGQLVEVQANLGEKSVEKNLEKIKKKFEPLQLDIPLLTGKMQSFKKVKFFKFIFQTILFFLNLRKFSQNICCIFKLTRIFMYFFILYFIMVF